MTPEGAGEPPDRDQDPRPQAPLQHLEPASTSFRGALRSLRRTRFLRRAFIIVAVLLLAVVSWEIWSNRPKRKVSTPPPPAESRPDNATPTLDKFEYTATELGKLAYRILADKLTGVEGGLHTVQGIRKAEFRLADGRTLTASADHGTFTPSEGGAVGASGASGASGATGASGNGGGGSEHARGHGHVVLEGNVVVTSDLGERLESDRIEYFQTESRLLSPGRCRFRLVPPPNSKGDLGPSEGEAGRIAYELSTKIIEMEGGVVITMSQEGVPETVVRSSQARFAADGTWADLLGSASIDRGGDNLSAPRIHMTRAGDGDQTHIVAEEGASGRLVPASGAGAAGGAGRGRADAARPTRAAARTIDATDVASTGERRVTLTGNASLTEEAAAGQPPGRALRARTIVLHEAPRAPGAAPASRSPRTLRAEQDVKATFPPAPGESAPRVLTCRTLDAVSAADGSLATADADGSVKLSWGARRSAAARAHVVGETHVELRGSRPVVEEPDRRIVADEIDYDTKPGQLTARGSVQTRFVPQSRADAKAPGGGGEPAVGTANGTPAPPASASPGGGLPFTPGLPVDVQSDTAVMKQDARTAEFTGHVRARQADRALSSAHLLVNDADKTARAEGSVTVRSFREESVPPAVRTETVSETAAPSAPKPPASAPKSAASTIKIPVQVDADTLLHDDAKKLTRFAGHTVYREPGRVLTADSVTLEGGSGAAPATTRAEGRVVYEGEGKRGTGDLAVHHEEGKTVTLEGHERPAQVVETASGRTWRGPSLTWVQAPDSIPVVTGTSGRSRIVGSIGSQQRDGVGKPADRGKPR